MTNYIPSRLLEDRFDFEKEDMCFEVDRDFDS